MKDPNPTCPSTEVRLPDALAAPAARLALRQQNLRTLLPVLLHDVNGSLNGLALSTELLSRLVPAAGSAGEGASSAASLVQRARNEIGRLKHALKGLENRILPGVLEAGGTPPRRAEVEASLHAVEEALTPAVRRNQIEWRMSLEQVVDRQFALTADDAFDLLAAFAIIGVETAQPGSRLELVARPADGRCVLTLTHAGAARTGFAAELHRELLRVVAVQLGGVADWQHHSDRHSSARLALPTAGN